MVRSVIRSTRSWPRRWRVLLSLVITVGAGMVFMQTLLAVHDTGVFELEGNAVTDLTHDWADVFNGTSQAAAASFVDDGSANNTIFTGGGSKDPQDLTAWKWKNAGGLPDKDNLVHSFAARYSLAPSATCPSGTAATCEILFFGSDRFDNSGDAQQGFWFFQKPVGTAYDTNNDGVPDTDCPASGGATTFCDPSTGSPAVHTNGDLLVLSDFSNGGERSTIAVFTWDSTFAGNLRPLSDPLGVAANCATAGGGDQFCGIVNPTSGTISPWPFTDKSGNHTFLNGELYEGGVNLSLLGLAAECFASVASETRSSTSTTATLKDFVIGTFGHCESGVVTTPQTAAGADIGAGGISIGTGSVSVRDHAVLTISGSANWSGTLNFFLCSPADLTSQSTCLTGGTSIGSVPVSDGTTPVSANSAAATITSAGKYCWRGEFDSGTTGVPDSTDASATECFTVNPVTPTVPTQASAAVLIGNPISDMANLSGTANKPGSPVINPTTAGSVAGGTITFNLYGPNDATCSVSIHSATVNVTGDGAYTDNFTPTTAGTYRWVASYSGDLPNTLNRSGACNDANESVIVNPKQPTITTDASADPPTGVPLGTAISDQATLTGTAPGAGGTITFTAYGPNDASCTTAVFTSSPVTVTGDGTYNSGPFTPTAAGTYRWIASYSGSLPNTLPVSGACNDAGEASLVISLTPHVATTQFFYPNDSATITVSSGGALAGNVRFRVWTNATCSGTPLYDSGNVNVTTGTGGALTRTLETSNTTNRVGAGSVYWQVDYDSTNPSHEDVPGTCGMENATITVTNKP